MNDIGASFGVKLEETNARLRRAGNEALKPFCICLKADDFQTSGGFGPPFFLAGHSLPKGTIEPGDPVSPSGPRRPYYE